MPAPSVVTPPVSGGKKSQVSRPVTGDKRQSTRKSTKQKIEDAARTSVVTSAEISKTLGPFHIDAHQAILDLQSPETHIVLEALNCLVQFCKMGENNKLLFIKMNGIIEARKFIFHGNNVIQRYAMKLIAITSTVHDAAIGLQDSDFTPDLIKLASLQDKVLIEYSTFSLSSLCLLETWRLQVVENGGVPLLVSLLSHDDPDIQKNSAVTIWRLLEEPLNIDLITSQDSIEPILKLIESEYLEIQIVALNILEKVALRDIGVQILESIGAIHPLGVKLAIPELTDLHRGILRILINMCQNQCARQNIVSLVPTTCQVLETSPDITAQVLALNLLGTLSIITCVAKGLVDYGMCKRVVEMLVKGERDMKEAAAFCVFQISQTDIRGKGLFINAIQPMLSLAEQTDLSDTGFEHLMMGFASLLEEKDKVCRTFVSHNGLQVFRKILDNFQKYSELGLISLLNCISLISNQSKFRTNCIEVGLLNVILNLYRAVTNTLLLTSSSNALYGLLSDEKGRRQFLSEYDGYNILVQLLCQNEAPAMSAVPLLHILTTYSDSRKGLIERGILQVVWARQDLISLSGPLRETFELLIATHFPTKYAVYGRIDPLEKIKDGFYDIGALKDTDRLQTTREMKWENRDPQRQVLYLNLGSEIKDTAALKHNESLQRAQRDGQKLHSLIDTVRSELSQIPEKNEKILVRLMAKAVSDHMGGVLEKWRKTVHMEEQDISHLQNKFKSVVIPISMIKNGAFRPRTLLFKALCDVFGVPCSIERGEYKRIWNVVLLQWKEPEIPVCPLISGEKDKENVENENVEKSPDTEELQAYVVDLIYQPGELLPVNSYDANTYCFV